MKNKVIWLSFIILFSFAPKNCLGKYSGGDGSESTPYRISTPYDMNDIGLHEEDWGSHFVMVNDVNLAQFTGTEFNIIGTSLGTQFTGVFDGNGQTIINFSYTFPGNDHLALFGYTGNDAQIKNLSMENVSVDAGLGPVGPAFNIAGLAGSNKGTISNCYVTGNVVGPELIGGLVGVSSGSIFNCYFNGSVVGKEYTGGLVGMNYYSTMSNCYFNGSVVGEEITGGLVGTNHHSTMSNCYVVGDVNGIITAGGLAGNNSGTISNCYAVGDINGISDVGGLVGHNSSGSYTKCFWDSDINPDVNGIGDATDPNVIGKSTAEMQKESTFTNWDFIEIWNIGENQTYPFLRVYPAGDLNHNGRVDGRDLAIIANHWLDGI